MSCLVSTRAVSCSDFLYVDSISNRSGEGYKVFRGTESSTELQVHTSIQSGSADCTFIADANDLGDYEFSLQDGFVDYEQVLADVKGAEEIPCSSD